jgi:hypothetical protein
MKLGVIIGSTVETYTKGMKFFEKFEKKFKCKIKKINNYNFKAKIGENEIDFLFCYKPYRNKNYLDSVKRWKEQGRKLPPPVTEVVKEVNKKVRPDRVLVLSFYGGFKGRLNQVYLPEKVSKKFIKERNNVLSDFKKIECQKIKFNNFLIGKIKGKVSSHITTNMLFSGEKFKGGAEELEKIARKLSKKYDSIDMEMYIIAKGIKKDLGFGVIGVASDVLTKKELHMEKGIVKQDLDLHIKYCFEAIEAMLK